VSEAQDDFIDERAIASGMKTDILVFLFHHNRPDQASAYKTLMGYSA
jgi:hypothetical protein